MKKKSLPDMENLIQVKYYFKEHPNTTLSVFLKTKEQVEAFKAKEEVIATNPKDARETALARNPKAKVVGVNVKF